MRFFTSLSLVPALAFVALSVASAADEYFPPPDSEGGWRTALDEKSMREKAGMDKEMLDRAWTVADRATANAGLVVVHKGWLVLEKYAGKAQRNVNPDMASTGKAFTSIACGIMLKEFHDKIPDGLDTKVFTDKYLPEALPLDDPRRAEIKLGHLLCMSAGYWGEGQTPSSMVHGKPGALKPVKGQDIRDLDMSSLRVPLWTAPGEGYSYSSPSPHIASIVLRHVTGMELQDYINERLGKPMGWGPWGYCLQRGDFHMPHANGAGSTALHSTDAARMAYCLAHNGRWKDKQLVPPEYLALCNKASPYNPHCPWTLQFEQNSDAHVMGAPRDAFWKSGAGGFCLYVVPSLDLVIYKMGGKDGQYDPTLTGLPQPQASPARDNWQPTPRTPFNEGSLQGDDGLRRVLELCCHAIVKQ